ncbi:MAG: enoyl-CoA hydratase/isomerase family protein [Myxococcales bacterium]|nr:enoyl-CoA hydratase/isomerase family protein [Myxococcales bacterium]
MIDFSESDGVGELVLRAEPCNEIGTAMVAALEGFLDGLDVDRIHTLILRSSVRGGFCAGADLRELQAGLASRPAAEHEPALRAFLDRIHAVMDRLDMLPVTTVGVIHGVCFGGGFELALTCDVLIAEKSARFCFPELRLGIIPGFGGIPRLRREVGDAVIRDLLLSGRSISGKRAQALGLCSQVVGRGEGLEAARALASQSGKFDDYARRACKKFIKKLPAEELAQEKELFIELALRPPLLAALTKFVESTDLRPYLP